MFIYISFVFLCSRSTEESRLPCFLVVMTNHTLSFPSVSFILTVHYIDGQIFSSQRAAKLQIGLHIILYKFQTHGKIIRMSVYLQVPLEKDLTLLIKIKTALASVGQLVGMSSSALKGHRFNSQSGHIPRQWIQSPVGAHMQSNRLISLSPPILSLSPHPYPFLSI